MTTLLSRNRDYRLLWGGQVFSETGFSTSMIAFPLLVLAVTGSAAQSGLVLGAVAVAQLVAGLPVAVTERAPARHLGREILAGLRWVWHQPQVRVTALCAISLNLFFSAYYLVII